MAPTTEQRDLSAAELFREYGEFVARFVFRLGVPAEAVDDTVQEVFLVAHQRGGYRVGPAKPTTYLGVIATHAAAAQRRKARARATREAGEPLEALRFQGPDPEHSLETRDQLRRLQAALDKLEPDLRATLLLADGEGETCVSIARAMGAPVGTVYWRLHEARRRFQRALSHVDAALDRASSKHTTANPGRTLAPVLARSTGVVIMAFGWLWPGWQGSKAHALVRETTPKMPVRYDVESGLSRHVQALAKQPPVELAQGVQTAAPAASKLAAMGGIKAGVAAVTSGAALLAGLYWVPAPGENRAPAPAVPVNETVASRGLEAPARPVQVAAPAADERVRPASKAGEQASEPTRAAPSLPQAAETARVEARSPERRTRAARAGLDPSAASTGPQRAVGDRSHPQAAGAEVAAYEARQPRAQTSRAQPVERISEVQALGRAQALLGSDPAQALMLVRKVAQNRAANYLAEERRYLEVMALSALNERRQARLAAESFLQAYPDSGFREQVERAGGSAGR